MTAATRKTKVVGGTRRRLTEVEFSRLYTRTARPLTAYIRRMTSDDDEARDLAQEAFLRLLRVEVPDLSERELDAYVYKTASRLVRDRWRRVQVDRKWREGLSLPDGRAHDQENVGLDVDRILQRLRPRDRAVVWLAYVEGRSHAEIAEILGLRAASIRVLLFRARKKLAGLLTSEGLAPEVTES